MLNMIFSAILGGVIGLLTSFLVTKWLFFNEKKLSIEKNKQERLLELMDMISELKITSIRLGGERLKQKEREEDRNKENKISKETAAEIEKLLEMGERVAILRQKIKYRLDSQKNQDLYHDIEDLSQFCIKEVNLEKGSKEYQTNKERLKATEEKIKSYFDQNWE